MSKVNETHVPASTDMQVVVIIVSRAEQKHRYTHESLSYLVFLLFHLEKSLADRLPYTEAVLGSVVFECLTYRKIAELPSC